MYPKICYSIKREYEKLGLPINGDFGRTLSIVFLALSFGAIIPLVGALVSIAAVVVWVIFWVKINGYKNELQKYNGHGFGEGTFSISDSSDILDR